MRRSSHGKDRVYVRTAVGLDVGHVDLVAQSVHVVKDLSQEVAMNDCFARWISATGPASLDDANDTFGSSHGCASVWDVE